MIASMLIGGLGNQMFQYAAGRALALRHGTDLILDHSSFAADQGVAVRRAYELDRLAIKARVAGPTRRLRLLLARRQQPALERLSGWHAVREAGAAFDPGFSALPDRSYLIGYWQSWRYLDGTQAAIASELQPAEALSARNQEMQRQMRDEASLSLHVRRGDYLSAQHAAHGVLGIDYYGSAIQRVVERAGVAPNALATHVFSDDLDWCRDAFAPLGLNLKLVDWNRGPDSWQDLFLMSACRHAIVANSSFSWWGAWLGDQAERVGARTVIAPARWFAGMDLPEADRCPPGWERV